METGGAGVRGWGGSEQTRGRLQVDHDSFVVGEEEVGILYDGTT